MALLADCERQVSARQVAPPVIKKPRQELQRFFKPAVKKELPPVVNVYNKSVTTLAQAIWKALDCPTMALTGGAVYTLYNRELREGPAPADYDFVIIDKTPEQLITALKKSLCRLQVSRHQRNKR